MKLLPLLSVTFVLNTAAYSATSSFSLANLGPTGTRAGTLSSANADASGGNITVTVSTQIVGTGNIYHAQAGTTGNGPQAENSNSFGYIFGAGDERTSLAGNSATVAASYVQLTMIFSEPIVIDSFLIRDIDRGNLTSNSDFIDTVWVTAANDANSVGVNYATIGTTSLEAIAWAGTIAYRGTAGLVANFQPGNTSTQLRVSTSTEITRLDVFINNSATAGDLQSHGVDLGGTISLSTPVPEPASCLLGAMGSLVIGLRRRR